MDNVLIDDFFIQKKLTNHSFWKQDKVFVKLSLIKKFRTKSSVISHFILTSELGIVDSLK